MTDDTSPHEAGAGLGVLGVLGALVAILTVGAYLTDRVGEALEWRLYLLSGTLFPLALFLLGMATRWPRLDASLMPLRAAFVAIGASAAVAFVGLAWDPAAVALTLACGVLAFVLGPGARYPEGDPWRTLRTPPGLLRAAGSFVTLLAACHALLRMLYWLWPTGLPPDKELKAVTQVFSQTGVTGLGFGRLLWLLVLVVGVGWVLRRAPTAPLRPRFAGGLWVLAVVVLAAGALRMPDFHRWRVMAHWGVLMGPADMVRDGGVLLWDVPSQYGFLNTLLLAWLPTATTFGSFRAVNATAITFAAVLVFSVLFSLRRSVPGFVLALAVAFSVVLVLPGESEVLDGPFTYPSLGPYRFVWVYVMLAIALWEANLLRMAGPTGRAAWVRLLVGSALWVIAVLWSIESGVWATATWIPALAWSRFLAARRTSGVGPALLRATGALGVPFGLLAATVYGIDLHYRHVLGIEPEYAAFGEYALSFQGGFFSMPFELLGPGSALIVMFLACSTALVWAFSRADAGRLQVVALAAWGATWASSSYFIPRSHPAVATAMVPIALAGFGIFWLARERDGAPWPAPILRQVTTAWLAVVLFAGTYDLGRLGSLGERLYEDPLASLEDELPRVDASLAGLMIEAGVKPGDRIVYIDPLPFPPFVPVLDTRGRRVSKLAPPRPWLPLAPNALVGPLSEERRQVYAERFRERRDITGGWLVLRRHRPFLGKGYLWKIHILIESQYEATQTWRNEAWVIEWREARQHPRRPRRQ